MASLVLGVAGSALGGSLFGASVLGGLFTGAQVGGAIGALVGTQIDAALTGTSRSITGPRISDVNIQASTEGSAIPRVFGRMRLAGQLIWASQFDETTATTSSGGKGTPSVTTSETDYSYSISFAVGLCEGVATRLGRVWANGTLLDLSQYTVRFYPGSETQTADPAMADIENGNTPAYRGLCYVVFEDMPLAARRRDRSPAASHIMAAVTPMSEAAEGYDLEITDGTNVVRTFAGVAQHSQAYTAAQQAADFPSGLPNPLIVNVYQLSSVVGRGRQKKESLYVR